ncbi:MAG: DUF3667 domain-containing protein, partial [Pedobacter sp.]
SHSIAHYFHFDNKFFQTLKPLITKPGIVTLDYLAGKRARYINPVSMYIFVSIVYFIVVSPPKHKQKDKPRTYTEVLKQRKKQQEAIHKVEQPLKTVGISEEISKTAQQAINQDMDRELFRVMSFSQQDSTLKALRNNYKQTKSDTLAKFIAKLEGIHIIKNDSTYNAYLARQQKLTDDKKDNFAERLIEKRRIGLGQNSDLINEKLEANRPKQYFLFMPLMALFIMINFRRNHIKYLDHLIFTIHGMTAFFIVSIVVQPIKKIFPESLSLLSTILELGLIAWICWYLFKSLKTFYQRKTSTTIWRMLWVIILYAILLRMSETVMINIIFYLAT